MTAALRLLIAGGGSVGFAGRVPTNFEITAAPQGAWAPIHQPHLYFNGHSYIGFTNDAGGVRVAIFDHATGTVTTSIIAADGTFSPADQHDDPGLVVAADGRLVAVYCHHVAASIFRKRSTNTLTADPTISGGWDSSINLDSSIGGTNYTYPNVLMLEDETNEPLYCFHRNIDGDGSNWEITKSTDNGATWGLLTNLVFGIRYYAMTHKSSGSRIDYVVCDGSWAEDFSSLYHFYYEGGSYFTSDGSIIAGSPPFDVSDFTLVYDGSSAGVRAPASIVNDGSEIAIAWPVQTGTPSAHIGEDEDYLYARAAVGSAAWDVNTIVTDVGALTFEFTEGGLAIDPRNINRVILSKRATSDVGEPFYLWDYRTADGGATWPSQRQLVDSGDPTMYPMFVRDYRPELEFVYLQGTFTDQNDYDTGIQGYGIST